MLVQISVATVLAVDIVIAVRAVRTLHPYLAEMRVGALAFRFRIGDHYFHAGQKFARLEKTQRVRTAFLDYSHSVVA